MRTFVHIMGGGASIAATAESVYVLRGNTLWKLKASDLSVDTQKELPAPERPADGATPPPMTK